MNACLSFSSLTLARVRGREVFINQHSVLLSNKITLGHISSKLRPILAKLHDVEPFFGMIIKHVGFSPFSVRTNKQTNKKTKT